LAVTRKVVNDCGRRSSRTAALSSSSRGLSQGEVGDPADAPETLPYEAGIDFRWKQYANTASEFLSPSGAHTLEGSLNIVNQLVFKEIAIAALERELMVMDDGASHGCKRVTVKGET
jgi:hypothetical protein